MKIHYWKNSGQNNSINQKGTFFLSNVILYPLDLRHASLQACHLLLNKCPLCSISLLNKMQEGNVDAMKVPKFLKMKHKISEA